MQNKKVSHSSGLKKRINFRFIALLTVVFLIQHLSFAALHQAFFVGGHGYNFSSFHYKQKQPTPEETSQVSLDIEVEVAEEDEVHNPHDTSEFTLEMYHIVLRRLYTSFINSRYQHLALAVHHQADRPLFVLHHSWKSHLS